MVAAEWSPEDPRSYEITEFQEGWEKGSRLGRDKKSGDYLVQYFSNDDKYHQHDFEFSTLKSNHDAFRRNHELINFDFKHYGIPEHHSVPHEGKPQYFFEEIFEKPHAHHRGYLYESYAKKQPHSYHEERFEKPHEYHHEIYEHHPTFHHEQYETPKFRDEHHERDSKTLVHTKHVLQPYHIHIEKKIPVKVGKGIHKP